MQSDAHYSWSPSKNWMNKEKTCTYKLCTFPDPWFSPSDRYAEINNRIYFTSAYTLYASVTNSAIFHVCAVEADVQTETPNRIYRLHRLQRKYVLLVGDQERDDEEGPGYHFKSWSRAGNSAGTLVRSQGLLACWEAALLFFITLQWKNSKR